MALSEELNNQKKPASGNPGKNNSGDESIEDVPMFRKKRIIIPALIILLAVIAGIYWYIGQLGYVSTDDAFIDGNKLSVSTKILGRITKLNVDEGDTVKQGQLLVQLDATDIKARENQSRAILNLARESISLANVNLAKAQDDFHRAEQQFNDKVIPKEQFDHAQKALEAAKAELNIDKTKIGTSQAQLDVIKTDLLNTSIYSPMDGVVF
jgi:membrane fusion protein (multidrug efflux system)